MDTRRPRNTSLAEDVALVLTTPSEIKQLLIIGSLGVLIGTIPSLIRNGLADSLPLVLVGLTLVNLIIGGAVVLSRFYLRRTRESRSFDSIEDVEETLQRIESLIKDQYGVDHEATEQIQQGHELLEEIKAEPNAQTREELIIQFDKKLDGVYNAIE